MARPWVNLVALDELYDEYGCDESCPMFYWRFQSAFFRRDGSSGWNDESVPVPAMSVATYGPCDEITGSRSTALPASQRYGMRLQWWRINRLPDHVEDDDGAAPEPF